MKASGFRSWSLALLLVPLTVAADDDPMSNARLNMLLKRVDEAAEGRPGFWQAKVKDRTVLVITDESADRMRIMTPVAEAGDLGKDTLFRLMQANFDSALDARYAIARDVLWGVYMHPLGSLTDEQFLTAIGQVINLAQTFGTTFSSGDLTFGGGDSGPLIRELLEKGRVL